MLGLVATLYYLTATYRRSPRFCELALPLVIRACRSWRSAGAGVAASYGMFGPQWTLGDVPALPARSHFSAATPCFTCSPPWRWLGETHHAGGPARAGRRGVESDDVPPRGRSSRPRQERHSQVKLDARGRAMQRTAANVKPLSNFIYRAMQVGVLLIAAGTILGGVWADYSWGRFWGWDPKEVWALITLLVYLIPLHGRFAGWVSTFGLVVASVVCFLSVDHGLVRRELRAGRGPAQLRLRRRGLAGNHERDHHGAAPRCRLPPAGAGTWDSTSRRPIPKLSRRPSRLNRARFGRGSRGQVVHLRHRDSLVDDLGTDDPVRDARE